MHTKTLLSTLSTSQLHRCSWIICWLQFMHCWLNCWIDIFGALINLNSIDFLSVRFFFYLGGRGSEFLGLLNTTRKVINITQKFLSPSGDSLVDIATISLFLKICKVIRIHSKKKIKIKSRTVFKSSMLNIDNIYWM
jgi:hypothetical protein